MDRDKWRIQDSTRGSSSSSSSSGKPTVNYINITRLPEGGIVNIDIKRQPGSGFTATVDQSPSSSDNFFRTSSLRGSSSLPGSITNFDDDFFDNTSSRIRSMLRQHQNKFEDSKFTINPREGNVQTIETNGATVVIKQPPLPVHVQSTGGSSSTGASPYRVVIHHPRSHSSESVVVETSSPGSPTTKHVISPRTGSTSNVSMLETKFPSLKAVSPFGQRSFLISSPLFGEGGGSRLSLFDRFNEHAPPAFFESKLRSASNPENIHVSRVTVVRDGTSGGGGTLGRERSKIHNIPIKIEGRDVDPAARSNKSSVIYKIPINLVSKTSTPDQQQQQQTGSQQLQQQQHIQVKPNRISIPIITHKKSTTPTSSSEAEEKLAALTKQLEDEMRMTGMPGAVPPKTIVGTPSTLNKPAAPSPPNAEIAPSQVPIKKPQVFDELEKPDISTPPVVEKSSDELGKDASTLAGKSLVAKDEEELKSFGPCNKCTKDVFIADGCKAMGKFYHTLCFYCSICNKSLRGKVFYDVKGTIYCEEDYKKSGYKQLSEVCKACSRLILDVVVQAAGHAYHTGCFKCGQCQSSLQDQNFIIDSKNTLLCVDDYYKINSMECAACKRLIKPADGSNEVGKVMVMNKSYHVDCLACSGCKKKLGTGSDSGCYPLNEDTIFCKMCYNKRKPS